MTQPQAPAADPNADPAATGGYPSGSVLTGTGGTQTTASTNAGGGGGLGGSATADNYDALLQQATQQIDQYTTQLAGLSGQVRQASATIAGMDPSDPGYAAATRNYDSLNASYVAAMNNLARAYDDRISVATKAMDSRWMQPGQTAVWQAQVRSDDTNSVHVQAETDALNATTGPQKDLLVAQAASTEAQARLDDANAGAIAAKTQPEIDQLKAQVTNTNAVTAQVTQATSAAEAKLPAEVKAGQASADALVTASEDARRKLRQAPTDSQAAALNQAGVDQQTAAAQQAIVGVQQAKQNLAKGATGTLAFLPQQLDAIRAGVQAIGDAARAGKVPSDPETLDSLLNQYINSTVGGTTISNASQQAQNALQDTFQRNVEQRQQNIGLEQSLANAGGNMASAIIPGLIAGVKDLPKGSTALGPAIQDIMNMAGQYTKQFQPPPQVQAPNMPPFLQAFAGQQPGAAAAAMTAPPAPTPQPAAPAPVSPAAPQTTISPDGTVTIQHTAAPAPIPPNQGATGPAGGTDWLFNSAASPIANANSLPNFMSGSAIATPADVNALWNRTG